ncbi:hypothetical protein CRM22_007929 [Opisthorchis felineus]|uniref:Uncharacterized protein n=1 Tax=Opisthorchis felineus TaxID=147828 RepID=A0A4S2LKN2_OPIFE|nr:hypothetical protein CRM22_007929 [Opisthorchis felineus]
MLVNQTGRIVYHKCHFSGASPLPQDPIHYFHHKSWDDFVHPTYADLWSRHQTKALEEGRLVHPTNMVSSSDGLSHPDISTSSAGGVEEDASVRILDCPDYRVQFGSQSFWVHTFSLPASRELPRGVATWTSVHVDGAAGENGSSDAFVVHYHRLYRDCPPLEVSVGFSQSAGDSLSIRTTLPMATSAGTRLEMRESILVSPSLSCTSTVDGIDDLDEHLPTTTYLYHHHPCSQTHDVNHHQKNAHVQHHQHSGVNNNLFDSRGPTVTYHHHHHAHHHHHHLPQTPISVTQSNNVSPPIYSPIKPMTLASGGTHIAISFPEPTTVINLDSLDQTASLTNHPHGHYHPHHHRHHQGHGLGHHHHHHIRHHSVTHNHVNTPVNKENTNMTMTNGGETVPKKTTTSVPTTSTRDLKRVMHLSTSKEHNGPAEQNELYRAPAGGTQSMFGSVDRHRANTADSSVGSPFQTGQPTCLVATREPQSDRSRPGHIHPVTPPPPRCSPSSAGQFTISLPTTSPASSVHKKEHGERVMQLQHLLPPEAIQKIRQIWKDIFGAGVARSDDRSLLSLGSISSGPANRVQPGGALREHFARRVRQIVRQYLGPNALVTAKQTRTTTPDGSVTAPQAPAEETKPAGPFSGRDENTSSGCTAPTPRLSATPAETASRNTNNNSGSHLPTVPVTGGSNATSTSQPVTPTSQELQTIVVQSSVGLDESQDSKTQETKIPLVTSACTTTVTKVTSSPLVDFKSTSNLSSESRQAYSQLPPSVPQPPPNMCVTDLQAARRASGNSKCCMLEWLLSEEADLDLLPASFYDSKPGPSSISVAKAPSVKPTETGSSALTIGTHSVVTANNTGVLPQYSSSHLPPSSVGATASASFCDSTSKQPLSIQLPTTISTPTTFCQSVLVSPVTPASLSSDSSRPLLGSPTATLTYPPCPNRELDQSGPASQPTPNRHTNSVESSPTSSTVATSRSNSLLVTSSEPGSPSVIPGHLESLARRPSEGGLNHQLIVNNRTREMAVHSSSRLTSPILDTSSAMSSLATASLEPVGRNKRRRSGPPTPQLVVPNCLHTSNNITRTRHVSQIDMPTNSVPVSNGPVSSLTQLLLQDFPSTNNSDSSDYDGNKTYGTTSSTNSPSYFHQSAFDSQTPHFVELGRMAPVSQTSSSDLVPVAGNLQYNASTPRAKCPPDLPSSIAGDLIPSSTVAHSKSGFPFFAPSGTNAPRVHSPPVYTLPTSGNPVTLSSTSYQSHLTDNPCSTPLPITSSIPFTPTIATAPTTEAPSSLCRLLLDPQLGPQNSSPESSIPSGTVVSTPKSSVTRGRTVYSSAARSLSSSSPKVTSHDVYEFSTASSESKGSPHSKSTESLSDSVFLEAANPASVSTSHLRPINIDTSYRQSTTCSTNSQPLSPKAIAEEVEFLNEILRRDELERSSAGDHLDSAYSPKLKRSRLDNSTRRFSGEPSLHVDGDHPFMNGDSDDESVEAVARICEQLQEGFVSKPMTSELNSNNISSTFSNYSQVIGPSRMPSSLTFASSPNNQSLRTVTSLEQLDSLTSPRSSSTISWSASSVQAPLRPAGGSHRVNKAAVAAALASQEAAASQRTKLANQRHLAEQRKRLLQHQLFNQVTVYSPTPSSNGISPTIIPPPALISPGLRSPPVKCTKQMRPNPTSDLGGRRIARRHSGSHQSTPRVTSTTVFGQSPSPTTPVTFNLTATTVVVLTPPTITTTSPGADYYRNCPPEQLSRYLKEVGPNVRVQLSAPISTNGEFLTPLSPPNTQKHGLQSIWPISSSPSVQTTQSIETTQPFGSHATWSGSISGASMVSRPITSIISPTTSEYDGWSQARPAPSLSPNVPVAISPVGVKSHGRSKGGGGEKANTGRTSRVNFRRASVASCPSSTSVDLTQEPSMMLSGPIDKLLVPGLAQPTLRPQSSEASQQPGSTFLIASPLYSPNPSYATTMNTVGADRHVPPTSPQLASSSTAITNPAQIRWTDGTVSRDISLTPQQQPRINSLPTTPTKYVVSYVPTTLSVITVSPTPDHTPPAQPSPHFPNNTTTIPATSARTPSITSSDQITNAFFLYPSPEQSSQGSVPRPPGTNFIYPPQEPSELIVLQSPIRSQLPHSAYTPATPVVPRSAAHARPTPSSVVGELQHPGVDPIMSHTTHKSSRAAEQTSFSESYVIVEPQVNAGSCGPMDTKLEDSLLPEDIINDVFDLETMVVAKQQQQLSAKNCGLRSNCSYSTYSPNLHELNAPPDLNTYPSTASSSPSPCSPRLSNTIPPDSRSYLSP